LILALPSEGNQSEGIDSDYEVRTYIIYRMMMDSYRIKIGKL